MGTLTGDELYKHIVQVLKKSVVVLCNECRKGWLAPPLPWTV